MYSYSLNCKAVVVVALLCYNIFLSQVTCADITTPQQTVAIPEGLYTLTYKFVEGKVIKYSMAIDMKDQISIAGTNEPLKMHLDLTSISTVKSIDPISGNATEGVNASITNGTMNGEPLPLAALPNSSTISTLVLSPTGQPISSPDQSALSQIPGLGSGLPLPLTSLSFLPTSPVKIGDSWSSKIPLDSLGIYLTSKMTLKSVSVANGESIAKIESDFTSAPETSTTVQNTDPPSDSNVLTGTVITYFDIGVGTAKTTTGKLSIDIANLPTAGVAAAGVQTKLHSDMTMKMTLQPSSDASADVTTLQSAQ